MPAFSAAMLSLTFGGAIGGAFQGYTIGNVLSAQLYEAATATLPFRGSSDAAVALARLHESPTPVTAHRPDLPGDLAAQLLDAPYVKAFGGDEL